MYTANKISILYDYYKIMIINVTSYKKLQRKGRKLLENKWVPQCQKVK